MLNLQRFCHQYALSYSRVLVPSALSGPAATRLGILAVDIGTTKSGFAFATDLFSPAEPLEVARLPPGTPAVAAAGPKVFAARTKALLQEPALTAGKQGGAKSKIFLPRFFGLVVGWPLSPDSGSAANPQCAYVDSVLRALQAERVFVPTVLWDERHSSAQARAMMKNAATGKTAPEHLWKTDMMAATAILQSFQTAARPLVAGLLRNARKEEGADGGKNEAENVSENVSETDEGPLR